VVAVVALELAGDRRHGERRELAAALGVEAVDRAEQRDAGDLGEVVLRLGAALVAAGQAAGEREEALEQLVARGEVAEAVVAAEQPLHPARARQRRPGRRPGGPWRGGCCCRCGDGNRPPW
jgi:hypothetical protein